MGGDGRGRAGAGSGDSGGAARAFPADTTLEQLASILALTNEHITLASRDGTIAYVNRTLPGISNEEAIGSSIFDWLDAASGQAARACIEHVFATGEPASYDARALSPNGELIDFTTRVAPLVRDGQVSAVVLLSMNIADLKRTEAALATSERKLRLAVDATDMGIWSWDAESDTVQWDDTMCRHFRVPRERAATTYAEYQSMIYAADREAVMASIGRAVETGVYADVEHRITTDDGEIRWLQIKGAALRDSDGNVVGLHGGVFDITERRQLEESLQLGQKLQAVGQLASGVAHNFNNMLAGVLTNLALAARRAPPSLHEILADATTSATRAAEVVRQLVEMTGHVPTTARRAGDVTETVHRVINMCRKTFDRGIELRLTCPPDLPPVKMSASQIEQALLNLAINARDAVQDARTEAPCVSVLVDTVAGDAAELNVIENKTADCYVRIRVSDNGPGVDDDVRARIFEPFFTTKSKTGSGLGLATALAAIVDHDGWLGCDAIAGNGASFTMYLPCTEDDVVEDHEPAATHRGSGRGTVLLVDDEDLVRRAVAALLEDGGYTVIQAADGASALERYAAEGQLIDLVLLDHSMPGLSGEQVLERLLALDADARVVLFTGHAPSPGRFREAVALLHKPISADRLFATIERHARKRG